MTISGTHFLYDFVHIIKNIRNNWITDQNKTIAWWDVDENGDRIMKQAKWCFIEWLHTYETKTLGGYGALCLQKSRLTSVSVRPRPIERQRVNFVLHVFSK